MNSRKWQIGMVALVVLTVGLASFVPFLWRWLKLRERQAWLAALTAGSLELSWLVLSQFSNPDEWDVVGSLAGLLGVLTIAYALITVWWQFRPLTKTEQTTEAW